MLARGRISLRPWPSRYVQQRSKFQARNLLKLKERGGFIQSVFPMEGEEHFVAHLQMQSRAMYAGFDPTAPSLHIGNLMVLMSLLHGQRSGHQPIAVIGSATARIGDPSGKSSERPLLSPKDIRHNSQQIRDIIQNIFDNHQKYFWKKDDLRKLILLDNEAWYKDVNLVDFLCLHGRHFRLSDLLSRDSIKSRMVVNKSDPNGGLNLAEFSYQIFQSFDWYYLMNEYQCSIQVGGSDQMGNIATGYDFVRRITRKRPDLYAILLPIITSETGDKLGKSSGSPIWLSPERTTPFDFYQFFVRIPDSMAFKMLCYFTFLSESEIRDIMQSHANKPEKLQAQKKLAEQLTMLIHGQEAMELARKASLILYSPEASELLATCDHQETQRIFAQAPRVKLLFTAGITLLDFAMKVGCFRHQSDAIRIIEAGGFYVNQVRCQNTDEVLLPNVHLLPNHLSLVRVGKKHFYLVEWTF